MCSGDAYTRRADDITKDVKRQCKVIDDTLLYDDTTTQNFWHTWDYLKLCGYNGITFNEEKFQFCQKEVEFAGFRVTADGVKPSREILKDILNFPEPTTLKLARSWFGLIEQVAWSYYISDTMNNFRDLVKPTVKTWMWIPTLSAEFKKAKEEIVKRVKEGVKAYDVNKLTCVSTDWSKLGVGFLVMQKHCDCEITNAPVCCKEGYKLVFAGIKKCSDAESRYAPIEGEAMGVVYSLEKARMFKLGFPNLLVTVDHLPLIPILGDRSLADIPNQRLYKLKEKCLRFRFTIRYCPGKLNKGPDCMSRVFGEEEETEENSELEELDSDTELGVAIGSCYIDHINEEQVFSLEDQAVTIQEVVQAGLKDPVYRVLMAGIKSGFPEKLEECPPLIAPYHNHHINISTVNQDDLEFLVFHDSGLRSRMIIPKALRNRVKKILHADHRRDLTRVKLRAAEHVYWTNMAGDLKSFIQQCEYCQVHMPSQQKEPLMPTKAPEYPFQMVAADYFEVKGHHYLIYVERYTWWNKTTWFPPGKSMSKELIKALRAEFADWGGPEELSCNRGTNLTSHEMRTWLQKWGVTLRESSARYPNSNGRAECAVKAAKKLVTGNTTPSGSLDTDKYLQASLAYRNSVIYPETGRTIAQTLLGRHLRGSLPAVISFYQLKREYVMD